MCGRFSLTFPVKDLLETLGAKGMDIAPRFNIAPTQDILILRADCESRRQVAFVRWGLIPNWSDTFPTGAPLINARCETVTSKPSFRNAFRSRRCLIPATGFYEWKKEGRKRLPFHITYRDRSPMLFGGIWDRWKNPKDPGQLIESCAIITCEACSEVKPLHNRMPVLIPKESSDRWLNEVPESAESLMVPYSGHDLLLTPANPVMNSGMVEGPECLQQ